MRFYDVREAEDADRDRWNAFVDEHRGRGFCNFQWRDVLKRSYHVPCHYLLAQDDEGKIGGILPSYISKDFRGRRHLYSLRHGMLTTDEKAAVALLENVRLFARDRRIFSTSITTGSQGVAASFPSKTKKCITLALRPTEEETWHALPRDTRQGINRSMRRGATIEWGMHNLKPFYDVYAENMLSKGVPIHGYGYFDAIAQGLASLADLIVVRAEGKIIAGMIVLWSRNAVDLYLGGWLFDYAKLIPYQLMFWETVRAAHKRGVFLVDMGESTEGSGTYKFKMNFGGEAQDIFYLSFENTTVRPETVEDEMPSGKEPGGGKSSGMKTGLRNRASGVIRKCPFWFRKKIAIYQKRHGRII
jgi:hypothetical protein